MCPRSYVEFYSGLGLVFLRLFMYSWFFLFFSFVSASSFCVFGGFPSRSRLTATQELFSIIALGRHFKVPLCHCWRAFRALWQKVVFSLSCTRLSFLGFPMEGCLLFEGRLSDGSLRCWRPISVRFPFQRDRLDSSHRCVAAPCPLTRFFSAPTRSSYDGMISCGYILA